jgi:hypothetical protein
MHVEKPVHMHAPLHLTCLQVYSEACEVLSAVADKLRTSEGRYMFGSKPSSLDALLFGHLVFYRSSPAAAPVLKAKVRVRESLYTEPAQHCWCQLAGQDAAAGVLTTLQLAA